MTDLFHAADMAARPAPKPATGLAALQPSGRFEQHGKARLFVHHCAKCGLLDAPFGFGCKPDPMKGIWLCREHRDELLAIEASQGGAA